MVSVRAYKESDKERVQNICLANADCAESSEDTKKYILLMYCNYYIEKEPENCFVAVNENDEAVGYIICAEDYEKYEQTFKAEYINQCASISPRRYVEAKLDLISHSMFKKDYPSHFHIDIDSAYQRMGLGSMLIGTLKEHLLSKGVKNMMMVCGEDNDLAISFYRKNGFREKKKKKMGHAMALEFEE